MQISPLGGCLVSALSIPNVENGTIPQLTLTLITITSLQLQTSKLPDYLTSTPPYNPQAQFCIQNVLVLIPNCIIINKKECHWPPNILLFSCPYYVQGTLSLSFHKVTMYLDCLTTSFLYILWWQWLLKKAQIMCLTENRATKCLYCLDGGGGGILLK